MTVNLLEELGLQPIKGAAMSNPIPVRFDEPTLRRLDRVEAIARAQGHREATRSSIVRAAVVQMLDGIEEAGIDLGGKQGTSQSEESLAY